MYQEFLPMPTDLTRDLKAVENDNTIGNKAIIAGTLKLTKPNLSSNGNGRVFVITCSKFMSHA